VGGKDLGPGKRWNRGRLRLGPFFRTAHFSEQKGFSGENVGRFQIVVLGNSKEVPEKFDVGYKPTIGKFLLGKMVALQFLEKFHCFLPVGPDFLGWANGGCDGCPELVADHRWSTTREGQRQRANCVFGRTLGETHFRSDRIARIFGRASFAFRKECSQFRFDVGRRGGATRAHGPVRGLAKPPSCRCPWPGIRIRGKETGKDRSGGGILRTSQDSRREGTPPHLWFMSRP